MTVLLKIQCPEGNLLSMSLEENMTGNMLKQRTYQHFKKRPDDQVLWFQKPSNGSEDDNGGNSTAKLELIDDMKTLKNHGIVDDTIIFEGRDLGKSAPDESELRRNIADKENFSYYYAHAKETPLPESYRNVAGGDPIPLGKNDLKDMPLEVKTKCWRSINQYSWTEGNSKSDLNDLVKIYITQKEVFSIGEKNMDVEIEYTEKGVEVKVSDKEKPELAGFKLSLKLHKEIDVGESEKRSYKVSGSKITVTLKKKGEDESCFPKWYDLKAE